MKLSHLIKELETIHETNGDLDVQIWKGGQRPCPWTSEKKIYITEGYGGPNIKGRITLFVAGKGEPLVGLATIITADGETYIDAVGGEDVPWTQKLMTAYSGPRLMPGHDDLGLIKDVAQIAKYLMWQTELGDKKADDIVSKIQNGKYGSHEGVWPQTDKAMSRLNGGVEP